MTDRFPFARLIYLLIPFSFLLPKFEIGQFFRFDPDIKPSISSGGASRFGFITAKRWMCCFEEIICCFLSTYVFFIHLHVDIILLVRNEGGLKMGGMLIRIDELYTRSAETDNYFLTI